MKPDTTLRMAATGEATMLAAAAGKRPTFSALAYSGGAIRPDSPHLDAPLVVDLASAKSEQRITANLDHDGQRIVGQTTRVSIGPRSIEVEGVITGDPEREGDAAETVVSHARRGFVWPVSVGAQIGDLEFVRAGESVTVNGRLFDGPVYVARNVTIRHIAFLSEPADQSATANIAARRAASTKGKQKMTFTKWCKANQVPTVVTPERRIMLLSAAALDDVEFEDKERAELMTAANDAPRNDDDRLRDSATMLSRAGHNRTTVRAKLDQAISDSWSVAQFKSEVELAGPERKIDPHLCSSGRAGTAGTNETLEAAFVMHAKGREFVARVYSPEIAEQAEELRVRSLHGLYEAHALANGRTPPLETAALIRAGGGGPSTYDVATIVGAGLEKIALDAFRAQSPTWPKYANKVPVKNFKSHTMIRINHLGQFEVVAPGGELKHGTIGENTFDVQADTQGKMFQLDRRDIINDDLGMLMQTATALGRMGAHAITRELWVLILGNTGNHFHADNKNLLTGGSSPLAIDSLGDAIRLLRKQVDAQGEPIDLVPKTLIVAPELEATGRQIIRSATLDRDTSSNDNLPTGTPIPKDIDLVVESRISNTNYTGNSLVQWYLYAAPGDAAVNVAFLDGRDSPTVETMDAPANLLGMIFRGYLDFGVAFGEPAAAVKSNGV